MRVGTASPLKGAQLRSMPIPRPSPHMFPQPRPPQQQQQQQRQQSQQQQAPAQSHLQPHSHVAQQQPPKQPQQQQQGPVPRAALVSTDFNPMEEPCWGPSGKQRGGDQAIGGLQQHKPQQHPPLHNADKDVPPPTSARRPTAAAAPAATTNRPGAGGETAAAAAGVAGNAQQQQQRRMYPGPPPLRVPGSQPSQMDQGPFNQERDAMPVKDSKMQNWRDGLIKEMASKRQGGFRPPSGAAAATAK